MRRALRNTSRNCQGVARAPIARGPLVVGVLASLLVACGSNSSSQGQPSSGVGSAEGVLQAKAAVAAYTGYTEAQFVAPGTAFDASKAKGKTAWVMDVTLSIPQDQALVKGIKAGLEAAGVNVRICDGLGTVAGAVQCATQGVQSNPDVIINQSLDPQTIAPELQQAASKGIPVIAGNLRDRNVPLNDPAVAWDFSLAGKLMADWAIADSNGKANAVILATLDVPNGIDVTQGARAEFDQLCPQCKVTTKLLPISRWGTDLQPLTQATLAADPTIGYVLPIYDGMTTFVAPAIKSVGAASRVKVASFNASIYAMQLLGGGDTLYADFGQPAAFQGWSFADQALRILTGQPWGNEKMPARLFTRDNVKGLHLTTDAWLAGDWYQLGDFQGQFKKLWGLA